MLLPCGSVMSLCCRSLVISMTSLIKKVLSLCWCSVVVFLTTLMKKKLSLLLFCCVSNTTLIDKVMSLCCCAVVSITFPIRRIKSFIVVLRLLTPRKLLYDLNKNLKETTDMQHTNSILSVCEPPTSPLTRRCDFAKYLHCGTKMVSSKKKHSSTVFIIISLLRKWARTSDKNHGSVKRCIRDNNP